MNKICGVCGGRHSERTAFCSARCATRFADEVIERYGLEIAGTLKYDYSQVPFHIVEPAFSDAKFLKSCGVAPL